MKTGILALALGSVLLAATAGSGCIDLSNRRRMVKRQVMYLQAYLSQNAFDKAAEMYTSDFVWTSALNKGAAAPTPGAPGKGKPPAKAKPMGDAAAFHKSLRDIPSHTQVLINQERIQELSPTEVLVVGNFQVRSADSTSFGNTTWDFSMTFVKVGETWKIKEIKERSARKSARA